MQHLHFESKRSRAFLRHWRWLAVSSAAVIGGMVLLNPASAQAQAAYGSYLGAGASFGVTSGGVNEPSQTGALIAVRYKFLRAPLSLRTQVMIGDNTAVVPTISYDVPLNWQADAYLGAGASIVNGNQTTPVGNRSSFVLQPGIDYALPNSNLVVFGNAVIAFDAYRNSNKAAVSLQGGVGLRF